MTNRRANSLSHLATYAALIVICGMAMFPFAWMISTSLKPDSQLVESPPRWMPSEFAWRNYKLAVFNETTHFPLWTRNTLIIAALAVIGTTFSSAVVAYGFARIRFPGRGALFAIMLSTMMIPFPVTMVPLFSIFVWLGKHTPFEWLGTSKPLWAPAWFGSAFSVFLLRQFFTTIPEELSEAARIDGCSEWGIFWRIMLPLSRPALSVVALFTFMWACAISWGLLSSCSGPPNTPSHWGFKPSNRSTAARRGTSLWPQACWSFCPCWCSFSSRKRPSLKGSPRPE